MIISIGAFDGFHRGHQKLFDVAREMARREKTSWGVVTFTPHPQRVFAPQSFVGLFTECERTILSKYLEVPSFHRLSFDRWLAEQSPHEFLDYLASSLPVEGIVVGEDFRFGRGRQGAPEVLRGECDRRGWKLHFEPSLTEDGMTVSSSSIRAFVTKGDVRRAADFLGYPFWVQGVVVSGDRRGRQLGFPTANLSLPAGKLIPERGVYAVAVLARNQWWGGALNVGFNPTFKGQRSIRFEVHLLDFNGDLYSDQIAVFLLERLRPEHRFPTLEALCEQMLADVASARSIWKGLRGQVSGWDPDRFRRALNDGGRDCGKLQVS